MKRRHVLGWVALAAIALALNLAVWRPDPFHWTVLLPALLGLLFGLAWTAATILTLADKTAIQDRSFGGLNATVSSGIFLGICVMIYIFVRQWDVSWDLTMEARRDLSPQTVRVLESMTQEVEVLCFFLGIEDELVQIARSKTFRFLDQCQQHTDLLQVEHLDPDVDRERLNALKVTHASPQGTIVLKCKDRQKIIVLSGGSPRLEERDFTNALVNVLRESKPVLYYLQGHGETDLASEDPQQGGSMLAQLLQGEAYELKPLTLSITEPEVPADCDVLSIANLSSDLHPRELTAVEAFLKRGGRLLLLIEPWTGVKLGASQREHLRPFLEEQYGISVGSDFCFAGQRKGKGRWQVELSPEEAPYKDVEEGFGEYKGAFNATHPITRSFDQVMVFEACRTVSKAKTMPQGVAVTELLRTPPDYWAESDVAGFFEGQPMTRSENERQGPLPVAVTAVMPVAPEQAHEGGPRDARILVVGDATFALNSGMTTPGNLNLALNAMGWLTEREELIAIRPSAKTDPPLMLTTGDKRAIAWISTLLTVQLVILAGLAMYVLRRKHQ